MLVQLVVAADEQNAIGVNNELPWHLPDDLKFFKAKTLNHPVVMGRKTFDSIGKPLPKRINVVLSRAHQNLPEGVLLKHDLKSCLQDLKAERNTLVSIIGGGQIFKEGLRYADKIWMTRVHTSLSNADVYFPELDEDIWNKVWEEFHAKDDKHAYDFTFQEWVRQPVL